MSMMSTRKSTFAVLVIYLASLLLVAVPAQAQIPTAAVSITCQPAEIKVDVKPGSTSGCKLIVSEEFTAFKKCYFKIFS